MQVKRLSHDQSTKAVASVWLDRSGYQQGIEVPEDLTPLGLISRLEYLLDRFEDDLVEQRRRLTEAEHRLPAYRERLGEVFGFEMELHEKEAELRALELALASNDQADSGDGDAPTEAGAA